MRLLIGLFLLLLFSAELFAQKKSTLIPGVEKFMDVEIYRDTMFHSAFPSVVKLPDGEILVAFRRAPDRRIFREKKNNHVDPNSYLVMVRSKDGEHWTKDPELIYAHPLGGSQDPCMLQLRNGTILCTSYIWAFIRPDGIQNLDKPYIEAGGAIFLGGYLIRSFDGGKSWGKPIYPPVVPTEINYSGLGGKLPAYNRGALYEGKDGRIFWAVASFDSESHNTSVHLLVSNDNGLTWKYSSVIARDSKISFNETSVYETPKGDILAFIRSEAYGDQACLARSTDGGKTFSQWEGMGFKGHPLHALRLPDNRVLLTYGYRHYPFGVRAKILNAECTDFATAPEMILRDDSNDGDVGYTWSVQLDTNRVLVVYYINCDGGKEIRHIAGTIIEIKPQEF